MVEEEEKKRGGGESPHCWEYNYVLVLNLYRDDGLENLVMRTVGHCALVSEAPKDDSDTDSPPDSTCESE